MTDHGCNAWGVAVGDSDWHDGNHVIHKESPALPRPCRVGRWAPGRPRTHLVCHLCRHAWWGCRRPWGL